MNEENLVKTEDSTEISKTPKQGRNLLPIIITLLVAAWLIGVSILGAGWLISREIAKQDTGNDPVNTTPQTNTPIDIVLPENKSQQGSTDAKVTVIEFADFQCPYCGEWQKEIYSKLKSEFIDTGKVKFAFWDFAFLGEESVKAAEAALCAKDQNKFWEFHDYLYLHQNGENQGTFSDINLKKFAGSIGLDQLMFNKCFDERTYKANIEESTNAGSSYGVSSTPTIFINGLKFEGVMPYENYKQIIESELAK